MTTNALSATEFANNLFDHIVDPLIALMAFIAILYLVFSVIRVIANSESNNRPAQFKHLFWSVIGIFVIFSIWTVITFIGRLAESDLTENLEKKERLEFSPYKILRPTNRFDPQVP